MTYQGVKFDDYVNDEMGIITQICNSCAVKHNFAHSMLEECGEPLTCCIVGCENESEHYLEIVKLEKEVY